MARELKLPKPIHKALTSAPARLPFESVLDRVLDRISAKLEQAAPTRFTRSLGKKIPYPAEFRVNTPLGNIGLPSLDLPRLDVPELDNRRKEAIKAAIGQDLSYFPGLIPVVGDIAANAIEDVFFGKIHEVLTPEELRKFVQWNKKSPLSTVAMLQTFIRVK